MSSHALRNLGALALALGLVACGGPGVDSQLWTQVVAPPGSDTVWEHADFDLAVSEAGGFFAFRGGIATLAAAPGGDLKAHLRETGLEVVATLGRTPAHTRITTQDAGLRAALEKRAARGTHSATTPRILLVRVPLEEADSDAIAALRSRDGRDREDDGDRLHAVSSDRGLKTLAAIAAHRLRHVREGWDLIPDMAYYPAALLHETREGEAYCELDADNEEVCEGDVLGDRYATLTQLGPGWHLAQAAENRLGRPVLLGIVDIGFATTVTDLVPDVVVSWDEIGEVGSATSPWHGTGVASVAAAPINDARGAAGTALYARGPGGGLRVDILGGGEVALLWAETNLMTGFALADTLLAALGAGADVVNMSVGGWCDGLCQLFGIYGGATALKTVLVIADNAAVPVIVGAGNPGANLDDPSVEFLPCEAPLGIQRPICVGGFDRGAVSVFSYGTAVDVTAPAFEVWVGPDPGTPQPHRRSGTSFATPFVSGAVAMAVAMGGAQLTNAEVRAALATGIAIDAPDFAARLAPRRIDLRAFWLGFARILPDGNAGAGPLDTISLAALDPDRIYTIADAGGSAPDAAASDSDWFIARDVPRCGSVRVLVTTTHRDLEATASLDGWTQSSPSPAGGARGDPLRVEFDIAPGPSLAAGSDVLGLGFRSSGAALAYSVDKVEVEPPALMGFEGPPGVFYCDGIDNDCNGLIDEGFPDSDGDGLADCVDPDSDNDCVSDANDNCPLVANAHRGCEEADVGFESNAFDPAGCGPRDCPRFEGIERALDGFDDALGTCFSGSPSDAACYDAGCAAPGPLERTDVARAFALWRQASDVLDARGRVSRGISWELKRLRDFRVAADGRLVVPRSLASRAQNSPSAATARLHDACGPFLRYGDRAVDLFEGANAQECLLEQSRAECLSDADADGVGDACDPDFE